ncbi:unnamed protein product [Paramecium sonneborni]|uniref:Transmembrane protein n=1 Tax=Paramecium sonneborni TaxID=65129 RepID=A0A8S1RQC8_9CILI|nr:unnamed protein product [Paramecium sonneborni]
MNQFNQLKFKMKKCLQFQCKIWFDFIIKWPQQQNIEISNLNLHHFMHVKQFVSNWKYKRNYVQVVLNLLYNSIKVLMLFKFHMIILNQRYPSYIINQILVTINQIQLFYFIQNLEE